jgi:hypothetical protein
MSVVISTVPVAASDASEGMLGDGTRTEKALPDIALSDMALVAVNNPAPGTAADLLAEGVMVVRDLERYLLVVAGGREMAVLSNLGLSWAVLDRPIGEKTYYTVGVRQGAKLSDIEANARVLRFDGLEAVVETSSEEAAMIVGAGFEIARVFIRPIRVKAEARLPELLPPMAPMAADPLIQQMVDSVSASTINAHVQRMQNFKTRYATTDSCQAAANWIKGKFESYGIDSVYFHHFNASYKDNVVAVIPGTANPDKIVVIGGHYDSSTSTINNCPGADDNATGTECVLECARILSNYQFNYTITLIAFGAEEEGLIGSDAYASEAAARGDDIIGMISVDMIGYLASGDVMDLDIISNTSSQWLRDLAFNVQDLYVANLPAVQGSLPGGASSDHASFWAAGYDAILFFEDTGSYSPYIHTTNDIVGTSYNSPTFAERSVKIGVSLVATMAEPFRVGISHAPLQDTEDAQHPYRVVATIKAAATLNPDSLRVYYSTGEGWNGLTMSATGNPDEYEAFIPAQQGGTYVTYYIVAEDTDGNRATDPTGAPATVHTFFVGTITAVFSDDFETAKGWTVGDVGDDATTGIWERCDPMETVAQPEDDHTPPPGVKAYITQCAAGTSQGSYDVDGGKTTLMSPVFDLSPYHNARVRFYRWYSNDTGSNPETDDWIVDVSADGGTTWVRLETISTSNRTWRLVEKDLTDYIDLTSQVKFRFIAADEDPGSIVEAGVDDFSIVTYEDAAAGISVARRGQMDKIVLAQSAPNPFGRETAIRFVVPAPGRKVTLSIFDATGRVVKTLLKEEKVVGSRTIHWDGTNALGHQVAAGFYFCQLRAGEESRLTKIALVR